MIKNKRILIITIYYIAISILLLSCTGSRELQTLAIVTSIGLDLEDHKVVVTCEIINPTSTAPTSANTSPTPTDIVFAQGEGETVFEAIRDVTLDFDRKLFFSHATVLIFGEEFAKHGITEFMDIFLRDNEPRENMYLLVAKGSKASEVIGVRGELSQTAGNYINDILDNYNNNGKCLRVSMAEYYRYYYAVSNEPVIGTIRKIEKTVIDQERYKKTPTKLVLNVAGGSVLKRDYLVGYFSEDEIFGYNFIVDRIKGGLIVFNTPKGLKNSKAVIGKEGSLTTIEILKSNTKREIKIIDGKIHLDINVKVRGSLGEENKAIDLGDLETRDVLQKSCSEKVKNLISLTMDKGQKEFKQDNFSIGELVHQQHPEVWKEIALDWNNIFSEITYSVNVETNIVKTGIINVPSNLRRRR